MIETEVEIERIIPIQPKLRGSSIRDIFVLGNEDLCVLPRITLVPYRLGKNFILVDGHHRATRYLFAEMTRVPSKILETDEEVEACYDGALSGCQLDSLEQVRHNYEKYWKRNCRNEKVYSSIFLKKIKLIKILINIYLILKDKYSSN